MRFLTRSLMGLFLLSLTLGLVAYAGNGIYAAVQARMSEEPRSRPARERVLSVNVVAYQPTEIAPEFSTFGEVVGRRTLDLRAPSTGTIVRVADALVEGGIVRAGDVLLEIDPTDAQSRLDIARTDRAEAEAELRDANRALVLAQDTLTGARDQDNLRARALARQRDLAVRGVGTAAAVEAAELAASTAAQAVLSQRQAVASAQSRIERAQITLNRTLIAFDEAKRDLSDTKLIAEFDGALADVTVVAGGMITANERIARLIDPTALEVAFRVSTAQYARLLDDAGELRKASVSVSLDVSGIDIIAETQISRASVSVGAGQTGRVLFAPLNTAPGFRPGDFVTARVVEPSMRGVALLPASAVDAAGRVLVLGQDDRLDDVATEILRRQGDSVIVRARDLAGRELVAKRSPLLGAGIKISPLRSNPDGTIVVAEPPAAIALDEARRAKLIAFVESNKRMPDAVRTRLLAQLAEPEVPAQVVERLEGRMGG